MENFVFKKIAGVIAFILGVYMAFQTTDNPQWLLGGGIVGAVGWLWMFTDGIRYKKIVKSTEPDPEEKFFNNLSFMGAALIFIITLGIWAIITQ